MSRKTEQKDSSNTPILDLIMVDGKLVREESQKPFAHNMIQEFVRQILQQGHVVDKNVTSFICARIAQIDALINDQLNEILHHSELMALEGSWRGLNFFLKNTPTSSRLKIRFMNVSKNELLSDFERAPEFDQSQTFKKIYEEEYGTFGGSPYSILIGDYAFSRRPRDMMLLGQIAGVASAAHAPFIAAADPELFDLDSFEELGVPRDLSKIFDSLDLAQWNSLRNKEDARYVTLTLPRVLMRLPYGHETNPVEGLNFEENMHGAPTRHFCWSNAAYILGQRITHSYAKYGWTAAIRGVEGGGLVEDLPAYTFKTSDGDIALKCPTEVAITDRREKELSDLGFIALCHCKGTDYAAFFGAQTIQRIKTYNHEDANANAAISARLPYILAASRFAHYIKVIMRDKIGSFMTRDEVELHLNTWVAQYVLLNDDAPQNVKARYPLREARVDVYDVPGKPGTYKSVIYLRPHFQMEELTASIRLVATLPPPINA